MARNLRAKMPASETLIISDTNRDVMEHFCQGVTKSHGSLKVEIAQSAKELAKRSVSRTSGSCIAYNIFFYSGVLTRDYRTS